MSDDDSLRDQIVHGLGHSAMLSMDIFGEQDVIDTTTEFCDVARRLTKLMSDGGMNTAQTSGVLTGIVIAATLDDR